MELDWICTQRNHCGHFRLCAHQYPQGRRFRPRRKQCARHAGLAGRLGRAVCRRRLHNVDVLRFLRGAHDRGEPRALPHRGATALSGGAVRYRIYSQFGLGVIDVAKICFLTGLTFWLGNFVVLGGGMAYRPDVPGRILQLSGETVRGIGIAALVVLCAYVAWASRRPRTIGIRNWRVRLPRGSSTLIQIGIGVADLGCSALAMYSAIPSAAEGELLTIAIAFVSATLLGYASHAPGSLGVFDAAMLVALPGVPKEELVAGLLVFRALYFLLPFCLALLTMACWESALFLRRGAAAARNRTK